jgi:hypothetical protein
MSSRAASHPSRQYGFPRRGLGPEEQPSDLGEASVAGRDVRLVAVADDERGGDDAAVLLRDEGAAFEDPRIDDHLARFALELGEDRVDRGGDPGDDGRGMRVDERRDLIAVGAAERADEYGHR